MKAGVRFLALASFLFLAELPSATLPEAAYSDAVWIGESGGALRVDAQSGSPTFRLASPADVVAVAIDDRRGLSWLLSQGSLFAFDFTGAPVTTIAIAPPESALVQAIYSAPPGSLDDFCRIVAAGLTVTNEEAWPSAQMAVDPGDGSIWVGMGSVLYHVSKGGAILSQEFLESAITSLAIDSETNQLWAGTCGRIRIYSGSGGLLATREVGDLDSWVKQIHYDASLGEMWVALRSRVERYAANLSPTFSQEFERAEFVQAIGSGYAWVGGGTSLSLVSAAGETVTTVSPLPGVLGDQEIVALSANLRDRSVWAASRTSISRINVLGQRTHGTTLSALGGSTLGRINAIAVYADTIAPELSITAPVDGIYISNSRPSLSLTYSDIGQGANIDTVEVTANGNAVPVACTNSGTTAVCTPVDELADGHKLFSVTIEDFGGNRSSAASRSVTVDTTPPAAPAAGLITLSPALGGRSTAIGLAGAVEGGAWVVLTNTRTGLSVTARANADGSFTIEIAAADGDVIAMRARDVANNLGAATSKSVGVLPPNPAARAPAIDPSRLTDFGDSIRFLYTGDDPIQRGVEAATIRPETVAAIRGRVLGRDGAPVAVVRVDIKDHPEFGYTVSRTDGTFDLAVNGGGALVLSYRKDGHVPVERQLDLPWRDYVVAPDVVMTPYDGRVTTITPGSPTLQVARGNPVSDSDGARTPTLFFPAGTTAQLRLPDGSTQSLAAANVRITEFTAGPSGPAAMPGDLPPTSAYTYAAEFSVDEAIEARAVSVEFSQPVIFYQENFLNFPVGQIVPLGAYDRERETWVAAENGRIVEILSITDGVAALDVDGSGLPASPEVRAGLGISDAELGQLGATYAVGQTLWRARFAHFTPWDANFPRGLPPDAEIPKVPAPTGGGLGSDNLNQPDKQCGSIIECQNQALGETVPIAGTPFALHYRSDRVPGRASAYTLKIPITGASIPASLKRVDVGVAVAGKTFLGSYTPATNLTHAFTWDGKDAYGRTPIGEQIATVDIGHVYDGVYYSAGDFVQSFARFGSTPISGSRTRQQITLHQSFRLTVGLFDARSQGFAGWTLSPHHAYDPVGRSVYFGDGSVQNGRTAYNVIEQVTASISPAIDVAIGRDGLVYVSRYSRIVRFGVDGVATTFAGGGSQTGDGVPATSAALSAVAHIAFGPDGSLYYVERGTFRIRKVAPDGRIYTVAGSGASGYEGDGGPATSAKLAGLDYLAVGPDGTVYFTDYVNDVLRSVTTDGLIQTLAGTGAYGFSGDGGPAKLAKLNTPLGVAVGPDGTVYVVDRDNARIRKRAVDGEGSDWVWWR